MNGAALEIEGLAVTRGGRVIVEGIDLCVRPGVITALIGPSGCGKTTILKCAALLERASGGVIRLEGREVHDLPERAIQREKLRGRKLAYVFQNHALFDNLSVRANLLWPLAAHGLGGRGRRRWLEAKVRESARRAGLPEDLLGRQIAALSGGERKRVAVARALVLDPPIVLYDEPTAGLDPVRSRAIDELILELKAQGMSALVASHEIESIRRLADEVLLLEKNAPEEAGRIVARGSFAEVAAHPRGAAFLTGRGAPAQPPGAQRRE